MLRRGEQLIEFDFNADTVSEFVDYITDYYDRRRRYIGGVFSGDLSFDGGTDTGTRAITYDQQGHVLTRLEEWDQNTDGTLDTSDSVTNTYNQQGLLLTRLRIFDSVNPFRDVTQTTTNTYDSQGHLLVSLERIDFLNAVVFITTTNTFDQQGNLIRHVRESYSPTDLSGETTITTNSYDHQANLLSEVVTTDFWRDGVADGVDSVRTTTNIYDQRHMLVTRLIEYGDNALAMSSLPGSM